MAKHPVQLPFLLATCLLAGCAGPRVVPQSIRGDLALPRTATLYVREFEEGDNWSSDAGDPILRSFITPQLMVLTSRLCDRLSELAPAKVLLNNIPTDGLLVTGQIIEVRTGSFPQVHCRILIFDMARSSHYPVTVFEVRSPPRQTLSLGAATLDDAWDFVARHARDFVRDHMR